jgi:glycosyltransferase involved in cell wall biosynthesis
MSEKSPLVSVILPTHNCAGILPYAIQSALYQTFTDFELWVVGDGCTDNSEEVVKNFDDPRINWLDLPKAPGIGYANRNVALRKSAGQYIAYLAHDDIWLPDHLELLFNRIVKEKKDFVYSQTANVSPYGIISISHFNLGNPECLKDFLAFRASPRLSSIMHHKSCLDKYGYWSESIKFGADVELWVRFYKAGKHMNFIIDPVPTSVLIFRAIWHGRSKKLWRKPKEDITSKLHLYKGVLPRQFQFNIIPSKKEQETLWSNISIDPIDWTHEFRKAIMIWNDTQLYDIDHLSYFLFQKFILLLKMPFMAYRKWVLKKETNKLLNRDLPD